MSRRNVPAFIAVLLAVSAFAFAPPGTEGTSASAARTASTERIQEKLFFALSIADEQGEIVAEPKLLGMCGVPVEMTLSEPGRLEVPRLSLLLEPEWQRDGSYEIAFELSIPGRLDRGKGSMRLRPGEEKSTQVAYPGGYFEVQLAAFTVPSPEFQLYLQHGARSLHQASRT